VDDHLGSLIVILAAPFAPLPDLSFEGIEDIATESLHPGENFRSLTEINSRKISVAFKFNGHRILRGDLFPFDNPFPMAAGFTL
jgi:hypothetical protein